MRLNGNSVSAGTTVLFPARRLIFFPQGFTNSMECVIITLTAEEDGFVGVFRKARIYFRAVSPFRAVCFSAQTAAAFRSANSRLAGRVVCVFRRAEILRLNAWTEILKYVAVYHFYIYAEKRWSTINIGDLSSSIFFLFRFSGFLKSTR